MKKTQNLLYQIFCYKAVFGACTMYMSRLVFNNSNSTCGKPQKKPFLCGPTTKAIEKLFFP